MENFNRERAFMSKPIDFGKRPKARIATQYPQVLGIDIPVPCKLIALEYARSELEKFPPIFWHRLFRSIYHDPSEIECELGNGGKAYSLRKTPDEDNWTIIGLDEHHIADIQENNFVPLPINWRYFLSLPSGGIIEFRTENQHTCIHLNRILRCKECEEKDNEEACRFIDVLLAEADRVRSTLFRPDKEFEKKDTLKLYLLFNVYLSSYLSGEEILNAAKSRENTLLLETLKYDAKTPDSIDKAKMQYVDHAMLKCGTYYCSAISYFFMALEGFVNLVFHAFLKESFRGKEFDIATRFDLEQKIRFMSVVCKGFKENGILQPDKYLKFRSLKKYRNILFHSKIEDSLKTLVFIENGFTYSCDSDGYRDTTFPCSKYNMTFNTVIEAKNIVDGIVEGILDMMKDDTRAQTEEYILRQAVIPISITPTGTLALGTFGSKTTP